MNDLSTLPILYPPAKQTEFEAIYHLLHSLKPWQRAAIRDVCAGLDRGIIRPEPAHVMVTDIRRVIASHRAMHELGVCDEVGGAS